MRGFLWRNDSYLRAMTVVRSAWLALLLLAKNELLLVVFLRSTPLFFLFLGCFCEGDLTLQNFVLFVLYCILVAWQQHRFLARARRRGRFLLEFRQVV